MYQTKNTTVSKIARNGDDNSSMSRKNIFMDTIQ